MEKKQSNSRRKKNETLPNSHLETRSKPEEEYTGVKTGDADNHAERISKRRFVEDDIIAINSLTTADKLNFDSVQKGYIDLQKNIRKIIRATIQNAPSGILIEELKKRKIIRRDWCAKGNVYVEVAEGVAPNRGSTMTKKELSPVTKEDYAVCEVEE